MEVCPLCKKQIEAGSDYCSCGFFIDTANDRTLLLLKVKNTLESMVKAHQSRRSVCWGVFWMLLGAGLAFLFHFFNVIRAQESFLYLYFAYVIMLYGLYETYARS